MLTPMGFEQKINRVRDSHMFTTNMLVLGLNMAKSRIYQESTNAEEWHEETPVQSTPAANNKPAAQRLSQWPTIIKLTRHGPTSFCPSCSVNSLSPVTPNQGECLPLKPKAAAVAQGEFIFNLKSFLSHIFTYKMTDVRKMKYETRLWLTVDLRQRPLKPAHSGTKAKRPACGFMSPGTVGLHDCQSSSLNQV